MKHLKRTLPLLLAAALLLALCQPALADGTPALRYTLSVRNAAGEEIANLRTLQVGDPVYIRISLTRTDIEGEYGIYGLEFKLKSTGLDYNDDGVGFAEGVGVTKNSFFDGDLTGVTYYDLAQVGMTIDNPLSVCTFSYTVSDPAKVNLALVTAIIYVSGSGPQEPEGDVRLTLDADGGAILGEDISGVYPKGTVLTLPGAEKEGYLFGGWIGSDGIYPAGASYTILQDEVLTARWAQRVDLTLLPNGGVLSADQDLSGPYAADSTVTLPTPSRSGYVFVGWTDGSATYPAGAYTVSASVTLTALWEKLAAPQPARPVYTAPDWVGPELETKLHPNYVVGYPDGSIHPGAGITRAEVAVIFYRLLTEDSRARYQAETNAFPDVADADWFHTAVSTLTGADILRGYPDGKFYPDRPITRAELTAIITRFVRASGGEAPFNDVDGHWAYDNIAQAAQNGWIKGYEDGSFRPDTEITRAETFAMVNRMLGRQPEKASDLVEGMNQFPDNQDSAEWYYLDVQEAANNHSYQRKADGFHERWTAKLEDIRW